MIPLRLKKQATNVYVCLCDFVSTVYKEFLQIHKKKKTQEKMGKRLEQALHRTK